MSHDEVGKNCREKKPGSAKTTSQERGVSKVEALPNHAARRNESQSCETRLSADESG